MIGRPTVKPNWLRPSLYPFGALLCLVSTYVSIGFIILVQLNYAVAPRLPGRARK